MAYTRYNCTIAGFEQCWAEISDTWTRREIRDYEATDDAAVDTLQNKIGACYLLSGDATVESGAEITADAILDMDVALHGFLLGLPYRVVAKRTVLGNASARASSQVNGKVPNPETTIPAPTTT